MIKNKINYVADGCMTFIDSLTYQHHADELSVLKRVKELLTQQINRIEASDPLRNK